MSRRNMPRRAFTLVELLVVIGIIALLMSILLPAMSAARQQGQSIKCLTNLRTIGQAIHMYANENKGCLVPCDVKGLTSDADGWATSDSIWTILVAMKYLPYPEVVDPNSPPSADNVFRCPGGVDGFVGVSSISTGLPNSRQDATGAMGKAYSSAGLMPGRTVFSWYGVNGTSSSQWYIPFQRCPSDDGKVLAPRKLSSIKDSSSVVAVFDGIQSVNYFSTNANRINARHGGKKKITNVLMLDTHAESLFTADLPGGDQDANPAGTSFGLPNLKNYPYPRWRLDQ